MSARPSNVLPLFGDALPAASPAASAAPLRAVRVAQAGQHRQAEDVEAIFALWQQVTGHARARLDMARRRVILARLADGYTRADLELAVYGCRLSAHHQGDNDRGEVYDGLTLILRDADHVDRFIAIAERVAQGMQARAAREQAQAACAEGAAAAAAEPPRAAPGPGYEVFLQQAVRMGIRVRGRRG